MISMIFLSLLMATDSRNVFSYEPVTDLKFNKDGKLKILQVLEPTQHPTT